ncbi:MULTISPECIES: hypothetical protein [unclassified Apibacter]|nr:MULTISPECIES: hypothetical protein [unclassified Apibacter]
MVYHYISTSLSYNPMLFPFPSNHTEASSPVWVIRMVICRGSSALS